MKTETKSLLVSVCGGGRLGRATRDYHARGKYIPFAARKKARGRPHVASGFFCIFAYLAKVRRTRPQQKDGEHRPNRKTESTDLAKNRGKGPRKKTGEKDRTKRRSMKVTHSNTPRRIATTAERRNCCSLNRGVGAALMAQSDNGGVVAPLSLDPSVYGFCHTHKIRKIYTSKGGFT